ncbi:histidine phosphotransferase family protein [Maritimibacter dapengensis]|uniref:Histidine phosphotransferase n=1 Tax=Maritimibacter dapengensis TaxID=2836868 RepID=A0ABS6T463_9RHOB|nr:histidine phosphotransferase family protein [Maritimibacter dapengensis]MBV7379336.1 histidine phosphotransferase [Maritimibacter dapengensis]
MSEAPDIVALVGSRICHDLASPLGAIGNGLELMTLSGVEETPEMALVNESLKGARGRIAFFRIAFGSAHDGDIVRAGEMAEALSALGARKLAMDWRLSGDMPRRDAKLVLLAVNCLETSMPFGGRISVTSADGRFLATGAAECFNVDDQAWAVMGGGPTTDITPAQVQFALLAEEIARQNRRLDHTSDAGQITLRF